MLQMTPQVFSSMVAHCLAGLPDEACGVIGGDPKTASVTRCFPTDNDARSAKLYVVNPLQHLKADREIEAAGGEIIGVFHSHTHTEGYPSPTDVACAYDPTWHYVIVSLRSALPMVRSYRIVEGRIDEEALVVG